MNISLNTPLAYSQVRRTAMQKSRFIVGFILITAAALLFAFAKGSYSTTGVMALGILGLVTIAISRRK
jgi:hypothetical protein